MSSEVRVVHADRSSEDAILHEARQTFAVLVASHKEAGIPTDIAPFNPGKALAKVEETVRDGWVIYALVGDVVAGILGLMPHEVWYSDAQILRERFLFIHPDHRGGDVLRALLAEARDLAQARGSVATILIANMQRRPGRSPRSDVERIGSTLTYIPGASYAVRPKDTP